MFDCLPRGIPVGIDFYLPFRAFALRCLWVLLDLGLLCLLWAGGCWCVCLMLNLRRGWCY